jgi:hypothetical protein
MVKVCGLVASGSEEVQVAGPCEHSSELPSFIKRGDFLDYLKYY